MRCNTPRWANGRCFLATEPGCAEHGAAIGPLFLLFCRWKCPAQCAIGLWPDVEHEQKVQISSRPVAAFSPPWGSAVDFSGADEAPLPQFRLPESKAD